MSLVNHNAHVSVKTRFFNKLSIDPKIGIVTKRSSKHSKFVDEIKWYLKCPKIARKYLPEIKEYSLSKPAFITMKYYPFKTLSELFLEDRMTLAQWEKIFERIERLLTEFRAFEADKSRKKELQSMKMMYCKKTLDRISLLEKDMKWSSILKTPFSINKKKYSIKKFRKDLNSEFLQRFSKKKVNFCLMHGDMCFDNMLLNPKTGELILIDPRGRFGEYEICGHQAYDIAKLSHSAVGFYELILNHRFEIKSSDHSFSYKILVSDKQHKISELFQKKILAKYDKNEIMFIHALLFISMTPLHAEDFYKQLVLFCHGLELFYNRKGK